MIKRASCAALLLALLGWASPGFAQSTSPVLLPNGCGTGNAPQSLAYLTVDPTLKLCVNATVSASVTGFRPATTGTPIAVTTVNSTGTLPGGGEVVATNVGTTNGAYCALGATASTSSQYIAPNGGWFGFGISGDTQLTCVTSTGTTTINLAGGTGLPTGTGGGGGGGGSGGNVNITQWATTTLGAPSNYGTSPGAVAVPGVNAFITNTPSVSVASSVLPPAAATSTLQGTNSATTAHTCATAGFSELGCLGQIDDDVKGPITAGTATIGAIGFDPSLGKGTPASAAINISTATTTQLVALSGTTKIYVTSFDVIAGGTGNITFEYGTGTNCGTGTTILTGAYNLTAQAGIAKGTGTGPVLIVPAGNALCALTSAAVQMSGSFSYQQF